MLFVLKNQNSKAQDVYLLFSKTSGAMANGPYTNEVLRINNRSRTEIGFSFSGSAFSGVQKCRFYTIDRNIFTVIPISQVSQDYPNALTHAWLANYMKTTDIDVAASYLDNLPNIYLIEMLPALGVAHIHKVKYITPYY